MGIAKVADVDGVLLTSVLSLLTIINCAGVGHLHPKLLLLVVLVVVYYLDCSYYYTNTNLGLVF